MGNALVIYVITKHHSMKTSTNCLIMNLAICDVLIAMLHGPWAIAYLYNGDQEFGGTMGNVICKIFAYGASVFLYCSIFNLVTIAIDRFLAVTRPLTYKLSSKWVVKMGIPAIWVSSALISIEALLPTEAEHADEDGSRKCTERNPRELYASLFCLVSSLITLIVLYSIICYRLWRRNIPGEVSSNQHVLAIRTARKVTVLMISVVIVFFVSWGPMFVSMLSQVTDIYFTSIIMQYPYLSIATYWLALNNSACNPCLYFVFIESFREGLKTACSRCRFPRFRLHRIGQGRRFETGGPMRNRQTLDIVNQEERNIELMAYSTFNK